MKQSGNFLRTRRRWTFEEKEVLKIIKRPHRSLCSVELVADITLMVCGAKQTIFVE